MYQYRRLPLIFLAIGSLLGVFLRWQFLSPTPGVNYTFFLHGHSHIMFLGWLFNVFYISFTEQHIPHEDQKFFRILFICMQVLIVAMLISFPLEGYGFFSIVFSTLHTLLAFAFVVAFLRRTRTLTSVSVWHARASLLFFALSTAGPFSLGYLMANGLGQTNWYYFSLYLYLHFQYNGFFLFAVLSLMFNLLEKKNIAFDAKKADTAGKILAAACIPAYALSILWSKPGLIFNIVGIVSASLQFIALALLAILLTSSRKQITNKFNSTSRLCLSIALIGFTVKLLLQFISGFPAIAEITMELRPVVIAYLHLVLLGVISVSVFAWYMESDFISSARLTPVIILFLISFIGMELSLVFTPWWSAIASFVGLSSSHYTFIFSAGLALSCLILCIASFRKKTDKNQ